MAGRMWGWLLICDPPEQTAARSPRRSRRVAARSAATARILPRPPGLIRRTTRRGDRREYFSAPPEALDSMLANAGVIYRQMREIAEHGLAAADGPTPERAGPARRSSTTSWRSSRHEVPRVIDRFLAEREASRTKRRRDDADRTGAGTPPAKGQA